MNKTAINLGFFRQMNSVLQTEAGECALACLAMILTWHGRDTDLRSLREEHGAGLRGLSVKNVLEIARGLQFAGRAVTLNLEELGALQLPCVLHWEMNHYVVLTKVHQSGITILDPARGEVRLSLRQVEAAFTGVAIELMPTLEFERKVTSQSISISKILANIVGLRPLIAKLIVLGLTLEGAAILGPLLTQWAIDGAIVSQDESLLSVIAMSLLLLMGLQTVVSFGRGWLVMYLGTHLSVQWMSNAFGHLLRLPLVWFERRHLGDISSRFSSIGFIQQTLTTGFIEAIIDGIMAIGTLCMMLVYSPLLATVPMVALCCYALLRYGMLGAFRRAAADSLGLQARQQSLFLEAVRAIQAIKLFGHEAGSQSRWESAFVNSTNRGIATQKLTLLSGALYAMLVSIEGIVLIWLGAKAVIHGNFSIGMLFAFLSYKDNFSSRASSLMDKVIQVVLLKVQADRVADIMLTAVEPTIPATSDTFAFEVIELRNVSFRYAKTEPWILKNLNLTIRRGERINLLERSGGGKTTLLKIMLGLLQPTEGTVLVNGRPMAELSTSVWREAIGAVMQDDQLLRGTIADNVGFFSELPDSQAIENCCRKAGVHHEIDRMPMRYRTLVSEMGASLSGGQRQRLFLARALFKAPQILILDEATAHLDADSEAHILQSLASMPLTIIQVSHTAAALEQVSRKIVLCSLNGRERVESQ